jgi:flagellar hook protein FlgE
METPSVRAARGIFVETVMATIQGTWITAVQGMNNQASALNRISNNIANVTTTSYKAEQYHFETLMNETSWNGDKFFALKTNDFRNVDQQGQIQSTTRNLDLALNGKGLFVTNTGLAGTGAWQFTRDGAFFGKASSTVDSNGNPQDVTLLTTSNGNYVYGWPANADGTFTQTNDVSSLVPIQYATSEVFPAKATSTIDLQGNLSASSTGRPTVALPYVDNDGASQSLTIGFTRNVDQTWNIDAVGPNGVSTSLAETSVSFDSLGNISDPPDGLIHVSVDNGSGPQDMTIDLTRLTSLAGDDGVTVQQVDQDGYIQGTLQNAYFTSDGTLVGSYSNQEVKPLFKLPVANFVNNSGLEALSGNMYMESQDSGSLTLQGLNNSLAGTQFVPGALESSTVDLSDQFSKMIVTQRAYSSSAQVFRTADEMTQAARDLKR